MTEPNRQQAARRKLTALDIYERKSGPKLTMLSLYDFPFARIAQDRAYVLALQAGEEPDDARIGPSAKAGWEWVGNVHPYQLQSLRG